MIKFFRRIRQNMLTENKFSKYLIYAIGEIVLVVIGILIALSINNWNEQRKERIIEQQILVDIKKSLISDVNNQINPNIEQLRKDLSNINAMSKMINENLPYNDSMSGKFRSLMFSKSLNWEVTAYMALENEGVKLIGNQKLKESIIKVYNSSYPTTKGNLGNFLNNLNSSFRPIMRENFLFKYNNEYIIYIPLNYESLKNNQEFKNALSTAWLNFTNILISFENLKLEINQAIQLTDDELKVF